MDEFEQMLKEKHSGEENAVLSRELEHRLGCKGTEIRRMVNDLRCCGVPICSCAFGYYYAANQSEIKRTISSLANRIKKIQAAMDGLRSCLKND